MAICPKCQSEMAQTAIACETCGYDFPEQVPIKKTRPPGIAHSLLADIALIISTIAAGLGCLLALLAIVILTYNFEFFYGLVVAPLSFFLELGMLVLFLRAQE